MVKKKKVSYRQPKMSGELGGGALDDVVGGADCVAGKHTETCASGYGAADGCEQGSTRPKECRIGISATEACRHGLDDRSG